MNKQIYTREKGRRLCDVYLDSMMILNYTEKERPYNKRLGKEFVIVYQEIYTLDDNMIDEYISQDEFPSLEKILVKDSLKGYKLKYNVNDTFYYMGLDSILPEICIQKYILIRFTLMKTIKQIIFYQELFTMVIYI